MANIGGQRITGWWARSLGAGALALCAAPVLGQLSAGERQVEAFEAQYEAQVETLVDELKEFADWCSSSKLYVERDRAYQCVLHFAPDDFDAHRGLKHKRQRDGSWVVSEDQAASRNYNPARLKACAERRRLVTEAFRDGALRWLEGSGDAISDLEQRVEADVLYLDSDDSVIRARRGWYVTPDATADPELLELRARLGLIEVNWMDEARQLLEAGRATPLPVLLSRSVDAMSVSDALVSYAFAAFLIEAYPDVLPALLAKVGSGVPSLSAVPEALGRPLPEIHARFVRWLSERR